MADKSSAQALESCFIHAPIEAIYKAFVEPLTLKEWLGLELDLVLELGGIYHLKASTGQVLEGVIDVIAWPEALSVTFDSGGFELRLEADFGGTTVSFESSGLEPFSDALQKLEAHLTRAGRR